MKGLFLTLSIILVVGFTSTTFANSATNLFSEISSTVGDAVDSTTMAVKTTIAEADTSSNFKNVYNDLKDGVVAISESLKVGAEHVYFILVKQQIVNSIVYLVLGIIAFIFGFFAFKQWGKIEFDSRGDVKEARPLIITAVFGCLSVILGLSFLFSIDNIIMGFANPEYGAIRDVVEFVQSSTDTDSECESCK